MDCSDSISGYSSDSSCSTDMNSSDINLIAVVNSKLSSYNTESDSDDVSPIKPYQFEPSGELLNSSSEESCEEGDDANDERLTNTDW